MCQALVLDSMGEVMKKEDIDDTLESYGLDRILEDNLMTLVDVVDILVDLGYLDLEMYQEEEGY